MSIFYKLNIFLNEKLSHFNILFISFIKMLRIRRLDVLILVNCLFHLTVYIELGNQSPGSNHSCVDIVPKCKNIEAMFVNIVAIFTLEFLQSGK